MVYVDFQNADAKGRLRLNAAGTFEDLARHGVRLCEGLLLQLYSEDEGSNGRAGSLRAVGTVEYSTDEGLWVASIDWSAINHKSNSAAPETSITTPPPPPDKCEIQ